ncbi:trypsin-5-like [Ischnura elegans]|uniref:trypsin-5-like n=1 Tax=Ischnura elegans TaxID=197161 RepID=UPI001ED8757F|nr:trypsin-5-like [Ischnura elegans]
MCTVAFTVAVFALIFPLGIALADANIPLHSFSKADHNRKSAAKIINGDVAGLGEFPSQVSIQLLGVHSFGGSILSYRWILTTAGVAYGQPEDYTVIAGTNILSHGGTFHRVEKVLPHLLYNESDGYANDIALMRLIDPITLGNFANTIPLYEGQLTEDMEGIAVGWGWFMKEHAGISNHLRKAKLRISNRAKCNFAYSEFGLTIKSSQFCAEDPMGLAGPCSGDAGGALIVDGKIAGIISWSLGCVLQGYPNVLTDVSHYVEWIRTIIECQP